MNATGQEVTFFLPKDFFLFLKWTISKVFIGYNVISVFCFGILATRRVGPQLPEQELTLCPAREGLV